MQTKQFKFFLFISILEIIFFSQHVSSVEPQFESATIIELKKLTQFPEKELIAILDFLKKKEEKHVPSWQPQYQTIIDLINKYDLQIGCEIGVAFGNQSQKIAQETDVEMLYSIDPYCHFPQNVYRDGMNLEQKHFDVLYYIVKARLDAFGQRSVLLRKTSALAAQLFEDNQLDFVYIDANHSYQHVKEDLHIWYNKIRPGGIIAGDDYNHPSHLGVKKAVDEFFAAKGLKIKIIEPTWWFRKPHFLSFIIPCYNRAHTIRRAIDSIYKQNLSIPFEVICTDDASTDNTLKILREYEQKYDNLHVYCHKKNMDAPETRNTCIFHAQGNLIFNLDSDNYLEPNSMQQLVELLDETGYEAACFEEVKFFREGNNTYCLSWIYKPRHEGIFDFIDAVSNTKSPISDGNYLFTKKSFERAGKYKEKACDGWAFGIRQLAAGTKIALLANSWYWHAISPDSHWSKNESLGINDFTYLTLLREFTELLNPQTNEILRNYNIKQHKFPNDLNAGRFKTIPEEALEHLFKAYKYEERKLYQKAANEYLQAIRIGANHEKILNRLQQVKQKLVDSSHYYTSDDFYSPLVASSYS